VDDSPPLDTSRQKTLLNRVVPSTVAVQVAIVMSSLTVPVLASTIAPAVGVPAYWVGYYSALIYGGATLSSFATPRLFRRWGGIRLHQGMLVMVAAALFALLPAMPAGFAASGIVLGLAYGPMNPASTVLLARYTPLHLRSRVFSFKQTAVPIGGTLAGLVTPLAAAAFGWRGAIAALGVVCLALSVLIQPWQPAIDQDGPSHDRNLSTNFWLPVRLIVENPGIRSVTLAGFAFGSLQFSFVAVFPTVLAHVGWSTTDAGRAMSVALVVGQDWLAADPRGDGRGDEPRLDRGVLPRRWLVGSRHDLARGAVWRVGVLLVGDRHRRGGPPRAPRAGARGQRRDYRRHVFWRAGWADPLQHRRSACRHRGPGLRDPRRPRRARHRAAVAEGCRLAGYSCA
jgi:hypothetical protein